MPLLRKATRRTAGKQQSYYRALDSTGCNNSPRLVVGHPPIHLREPAPRLQAKAKYDPQRNPERSPLKTTFVTKNPRGSSYISHFRGNRAGLSPIEGGETVTSGLGHGQLHLQQKYRLRMQGLEKITWAPHLSRKVRASLFRRKSAS